MSSILTALLHFIPFGDEIGGAIDAIEGVSKKADELKNNPGENRGKLARHKARSLTKDLLDLPVKFAKDKTKEVALGLLEETPFYKSFMIASNINKRANKHLTKAKLDLQRNQKIAVANQLRDKKKAEAERKKKEKEASKLKKQTEKDIKEETRYRNTIAKLNAQSKKKSPNQRIQNYTGVVTGNPNRNVIRQQVTSTNVGERGVYDRRTNRINLSDKELADSDNTNDSQNQKQPYVYDRRKNRVSLPEDNNQPQNLTTQQQNKIVNSIVASTKSNTDEQKERRRQYARDYYNKNKEKIKERRTARILQSVAAAINANSQDVKIVDSKINVVTTAVTNDQTRLEKIANDVNALMDYITSDNTDIANLQRQIDDNADTLKGLIRDIDSVFEYLTQNEKAQEVQQNAEAKIAEQERDQKQKDYIAQLEETENIEEQNKPENKEAELIATLESLSKKGELDEFFNGGDSDGSDESGGIIGKLFHWF